jgi:hypothetical protein
MKLIVALALLLASLTASAITSFQCLPKTKITPNETHGTALRTAKSDLGRWVAFWCGAQDPADSAHWIWRMNRFAVLAKYSKPLEDAIAAAGGDVETLGVLNAVINMPQVVPVEGTIDDYEFKMLRWSACQALSTKPYDIPVLDLPTNYCGPQPTKPPIGTPQAGWKAAGTTIFKYANGRLTSATTRKATAGAPCDGVTVVTAGASVYQGLVGGPADEKTACTKP